ncbi:MAG: hypothetical protein EP326_11470 [Deltaproteobacteria bacterium]|jgi:hypothetical protein|nr:MAG: hypothetical protein EP326_11470 [Deltaproteobacteria bacterium]TNF30681.1 MAG: hypothetical protein EP319_04475 [Deltaproteobacteria bacterium]
MRLKTKVDFRKYIVITMISTAFCCLFARNTSEVVGIFIIYVAALLNQMMLTEIVLEMTAPEEEKIYSKGSMITLGIGKLVVLIAGITLGVHFMGNRIIIPVLNYVIQIFALGFSLKQGEPVEKK